MLLELHEMQQVAPKSHQDVHDLAKARREAERQQSIRFATKWGGIVAGIVILAMIAPTRSTISLILYALSIGAAVCAMFNSPDNFNLKPVGEIGDGDIAPEHEPATDEQVVKLISAAEVDPRIDQVVRPWLESGHPIRVEQFTAVQKFTAKATKAVNEKVHRAALQQKRDAYLKPSPHVARENEELDDMAMPVVAAAAAALLSSRETAIPHRHDDAAAHVPGYGPMEIPRDNAAYHEDASYSTHTPSHEKLPSASLIDDCATRRAETSAADTDFSCTPDYSNPGSGNSASMPIE